MARDPPAVHLESAEARDWPPLRYTLRDLFAKQLDIDSFWQAPLDVEHSPGAEPARRPTALEP